ncbi:dihydrofolate reductase family protein [Arenibaculum sp.]|uniref:dihydrofolate reductase family protein n=1 Tax=Arenibaculum sp. TaxID=2865862 RepID=UPI002E141277|nr:dihydrofolate reductase family protein [Arenibaculum sp.]
MAKLVLSMFTSLDGYIEMPGGTFVPPAWSDDLERHWSGYALERAGHLLYGRTNFLFNKGFWSAADTDPDSPAAGIAYAGTMNRLPKTVFSRTLDGDPGWNATLVRDDVAGAVGRLKETASGDLYSFGGAGLANSLVALDLVDEYRLMVTPELFGAGKRLFEEGRPRVPLALIEAKPLDTGAVILHYRRERGA